MECLNLVVRISNTAQNILSMIQNNDPLFEQKKFILSNIDIYPLRLQIDLLENIVDNRDCEFVQQLFMLSTSGNTVGS